MNVKELTLQEKIGQMLLVGMDTDHPAERIEDLLLHHKIGGVLLYKKNYATYEEMIELINYIKMVNRKINKCPLLIAIDQEGGRVNRLPSEFLNLPSSSVLAKEIEAEKLVEKAGTITGEILRKCGFQMDFAPVLDVKRFEDKKAIGDRAYSDDIHQVTKLGITYMKALQNQKIISVIKHFPGHGATKTDSHFMLPIIKKDIQELEKQDIQPFQKAIEKGADSMLIAHLLIPKLTGNVPASMSKQFIQNYVRTKLNFQGVLITDDMRMKACQLLYGKNRSIKKAFVAGNDIIVFKYRNQDTIYQQLIQLVKKGKITEEQINQSVNRILQIKKKYEVNDEEIKEFLPIESYNQRILEIREKIELKQ